MVAKELWALDFDGVICDSCGESALSAWKAAAKLWPSIFTEETAIAKKDDIMEKMRIVRPVVETGVLRCPVQCEVCAQATFAHTERAPRLRMATS
jgi:hypothetical protein